MWFILSEKIWVSYVKAAIDMNKILFMSKHFFGFPSSERIPFKITTCIKNTEFRLQL